MNIQFLWPKAIAKPTTNKMLSLAQQHIFPFKYNFGSINNKDKEDDNAWVF